MSSMDSRSRSARFKPVYHSDVRTFEVFDHDGAPLALYVADFFRTRQQTGRSLDEPSLRALDAALGPKPVVTNNLNVPKPQPGRRHC